MSLTIEKGAGVEFEQVPEGTYVARCFRVIDLGTQETSYMGEPKKQKKVMLSWEILGLPGGGDPPKFTIEEDGKQVEKVFTVHKRYTASLNENSHLFKDLTSWRGKKFTQEELLGFDLKNVLGTYCMLQVVHEESGDRTFANVNAIMKTTEKPEPVLENVHFDLDEPDHNVYEALSDSIKQTIAKSPEWNNQGKTDDAAKPDDKPAKPQTKEEIEKEEASLDDIPF